MAEASARSAAALAVAEVLRGRSLTETLAEQQKSCGEDDRALAAELAYGTCRWWHWAQAILRLILQKPLRAKDNDLLALLAVGLYQLYHTRIPAHAAIAETAEAARILNKSWAVGLVNALLRRFQREQDALLAKAQQQDSARYSQPQWLLESVRRDWPQHWRSLFEAQLERPLFSIRVNLARISLADYQQRLQYLGISSQTVDGIPSALIIEQALTVEELPGFAHGLVSVQDAGAQLAAVLLAPNAGELVLDACAAPGGKTGHLLEFAEVNLTALDSDPARLARVAENLSRLRYQADLVTADASAASGKWHKKSYDRILLDAPCSATGVIRRHPDIKLLRRPADISELADRQYGILGNLWTLLKPGGRMLYATCSLLTEENDQQIKRFLAEASDAQALPLSHPLAVSTQFGLQTLPGLSQTDGFYYALLEKG